MARGGLTVAGAVVGLAIFAGLAVFAGPALAKGRRQVATLVVRVSGLPSGVAPRVRVSGPGGFTRSVSRGSVRLSGLRAGRYVLAVGAAHGRGIAWMASGKARRVVVPLRAGVRRVSVAYSLGRRDDAKVIASGQVRGAQAGNGGTESLVLTKQAAKGLKVGGFVVLGVTRATPYGFIGKVRSITPSGSVVRVLAVPASLFDVVPEGELDLRTPPPKPASASASALRPAGVPGLSTFKKNLACSGEVQASLEGHVAASVAPQLHLGWHVHGFGLPSVDARFEADMSEGSSLTASLSAQGSCKLASTRILGPYNLDTFVVDVAGIPATITPSLELDLSGQAEHVGIGHRDPGAGPLRQRGGQLQRRARLDVLELSSHLQPSPSHRHGQGGCRGGADGEDDRADRPDPDRSQARDRPRRLHHRGAGAARRRVL